MLAPKRFWAFIVACFLWFSICYTNLTPLFAWHVSHTENQAGSGRYQTSTTELAPADSTALLLPQHAKKGVTVFDFKSMPKKRDQKNSVWRLLAGTCRTPMHRSPPKAPASSCCTAWWRSCLHAMGIEPLPTPTGCSWAGFWMSLSASSAS